LLIAGAQDRRGPASEPRWARADVSGRLAAEQHGSPVIIER
jgi:hypothetical protein